MSDTFVIKYDGGDADSHSIDMKLFGESLQGIEKLISDLLIVGSYKRLPKKRERAPLVVKAGEPTQGTVTVPVGLSEAAIYLQLGWQIFGENTSEIIGNWLKGVVAFNLGKSSEAEQAMQHVADIAARTTSVLEKAQDQRHIETMEMLALIRQILPKTSNPLTQAVAPVGRSVERLWLRFRNVPQIEVSASDAESIRARAELEWQPIAPWALRTDGFVFHNRKLDIEHPDRAGYFRADVEDPAAELEGNAYAQAAQRKALIGVQARAAYRAGELERLVILQFDGEINQAA